MADQDYKEYVKQRIETLVPILARSAVGDYSMDVPLDTNHDDFSELFAGVQFMIEAIRDQLAEIDQRNAELRAKIDELEHDRASDEALLGSIGEAVVAVDESGLIVFVNQEMVEMIKIPHEKILGQHFDVFVVEDMAGRPVPRERRALERALSTGDHFSTGDEYYYVVSGERFPVWVTASPIKVGDKITGAISVSRNITKEKEVDRMKSELVYLASHQLRTPASAVKSSLSLLLDGYMGQLQPDQLADLKTAYSENDYELRLIDDILDVARLDSKKLDLNISRVSISALVDKVVDEELPAALERKQSIQLKAPPRLMAEVDSDKIRMVLENLVSNAIKYTPMGGKIRVAVSAKGNEILIKVKDNGIGIAPDELSNMFKRFSRASNAIKINMAGTGLGLYLAKSIVEMHHGMIELSSKLGHGSVFTVRLPKKYKEVDESNG
jgi:two-component system phosphate regulon sensor histidine kinase PhoR